MTIEPQNVRVQIGAIVMPHRSKTLDHYQADLRRKYGKMPSLTELAKMENRTVTRSLSIASETTLTEADVKRLQSMRAAMAMKTRATLDRILACLTEPKTAAQLEAEVHLSRQSIGAHLRAAYDRGEVERSNYNRKTGVIWSRA